MMQYNNESQQLARAYIPFQQLGELFTPECALVYGTAFLELHQPYVFQPHMERE